MRVLVLIGATFAAGLLAGAMFWPDQRPARLPARDGGAGERDPWAWDRGNRGEPGRPRPHASEVAPADPGRRANASVRELTRDAEASLAQAGGAGAASDAGGTTLGDGEISGTVRDPAGEPVAGVVVTALPESQPFDVSADRRRARERSHLDRDLSQVAAEAIQVELWRRSSRRTARTGPDGRFEIDGLADGMHRVRAFHDDFDVEPMQRNRARVQPDAVVDFLARRVAEVPVSVRLAHGGAADHAWVVWRTENDNGREPWTKASDEVRLPVGTVQLKAEVWTPAPMESAETELTVRDGEPNERVELALEGRRVLAASLKLPEGLVQPRSVTYRLRLLDNRGSDDLDPASLLRDRAPKKPWSRDPGHAYWADLEPGRYLVAAFLDGRRLLAHAEAEVEEGMTQVELPVDEDELGESIAVRLLGPDGGPVPGRARFRIRTTTKGRSRNHRVTAMQRDDGSWTVLLEGVPKGDAPDATLRVNSQYGSATEDFQLRPGGTITIRFGKPGVVKLRLEGYAGSGAEGSLYAALRAEGKGGAGAMSPVGADGTAELRTQTGSYRLQLVVRRGGRNWVVHAEPTRVTEGEDDVTVRMPPLYAVTVRWAGGGRPRNAVLRCTDPQLGGFRRVARLSDKTASFGLLAAGQYELRVGRSRKEFRVPTGGEVVLE